MRFWAILYRVIPRFCLRCVGNFILWGLWLFLSTTLALLLWLAYSNEIRLPQPALRLIERKLARNGYSVRIGSASFDTQGLLLVRDFSLYLDGMDDPILHGALASTKIDPWSCLAGYIEVHKVELSGLELRFPSALSPSGQPEAFVADTDLILEWDQRQLRIQQFNTRIGQHRLHVHGALALPAPAHTAPHATKASLPEPEKVVQWLRQAAHYYPELDRVPPSHLELVLTPSDKTLAEADLRLLIPSLSVPVPLKDRTEIIEAREIELRTRLPLKPTAPFPARIQLDIAELRHERGTLTGLKVLAEAPVDLSSVQALRQTRPQMQLRAARLLDTQHGVSLDGLSLAAAPLGEGWSSWSADLSASLLGHLVALRGSGDISRRTADAVLRVEADDEILAAAERLINKPVLKWVSLPHTVSADFNVHFGGTLASLHADSFVEGADVTIYHMPFEHVSGRVRFDGTYFIADQAMLNTGENVARGSYEMDFKTRDYRFLLEGGIRPMVIQVWFKEWWAAIWKDLEFNGRLPAANVDIKGRWGANHIVQVFVGATAPEARVRGVDFKALEAQVFVRNSYANILHFQASREVGEAHGSFNIVHDPNGPGWSYVDFDVYSTVDYAGAIPMFPPSLQPVARQFGFEDAPKVHAWGRMYNPANYSEGMAQELEFTASATGSLGFKGFHVENPSADGAWHAGKLSLTNVKATLAGGSVTGTAEVIASDPQRPLHFKASARDVHLGDIVSQAESRVAEMKAKPGMASSAKGTQERLASLRIDLDAEANGHLLELFSYKGKGEAKVYGAELAKVRLLGGLSTLLSFTSLRFTEAKAEFTLDETRLQFQSIRATGRNSAIHASGTFDMPVAGLDFKAKVWPFEQSNGLVPSALGFVLTPISHAFEVRLSGSLANPAWNFVYNPLRILSTPENASGAQPAQAKEDKPVPETDSNPMP